MTQSKETLDQWGALIGLVDLVVPHKEDLIGLSRSELGFILHKLREIREDPIQAGVKMAKPEPHQAFVADLSPYYAAYVPGTHEAELRIIYDYQEAENRVEVIAIGRRMRSEVHQLAAKRIKEKKGIKPRHMRGYGAARRIRKED